MTKPIKKWPQIWFFNALSSGRFSHRNPYACSQLSGSTRNECCRRESGIWQRPEKVLRADSNLESSVPPFFNFPMRIHGHDHDMIEGLAFRFKFRILSSSILLYGYVVVIECFAYRFMGRFFIYSIFQLFISSILQCQFLFGIVDFAHRLNSQTF